MTWPPLTESDIADALEAGDVTESNRLDFKALVGDNDRGRRETAKDMASFAVDGGALLIGISEDKSARSFHLAPVDLHDVVERIEQIAGNRVDPPLVVRPREIPAAQDGLGYVWVDVPASPDAPHMVDGRYYGRGERTNRTLSDADVRRLHSKRRSTELDLHDALTALQAKDPFPGARPGGNASERPRTRFGHLYFVATPRSATSGLAETLVWDQPRSVQDLAVSATRAVPDDLRNWVYLAGGYSAVSRSNALSVTNLGGDEIQKEGTEAYGYDIRIGTDGSVGYTVTRVTVPTDETASASQALDPVVLTVAWHALEIARGLATSTGFTGTWDLGLRLTRLEGATSMVFDDPRYFRHEGVPYDEPEYERVGSATLADLEDPNDTVRRLTQPLLRGLASWNRWVEALPELRGGEG